MNGKIYKKLIDDNSNSYLGYLNKLIDEYNNSYHCSISKKPIDADHYVLTEEIETNPKTSKFKVSGRFRISKCNSIFSKGYNINWSREIFVIGNVLKN